LDLGNTLLYEGTLIKDFIITMSVKLGCILCLSERVME